MRLQADGQITQPPPKAGVIWALGPGDLFPVETLKLTGAPADGMNSQAAVFISMLGGVVDHEAHQDSRGRSGLAGRIRGWVGRVGRGGRPEPVTGPSTGGYGDGVDRTAVAGRHYSGLLAAVRRQQLLDSLERRRAVPPAPSDRDVDAYEEHLERIAAQDVWPYQQVVDREA